MSSGQPHPGRALGRFEVAIRLAVPAAAALTLVVVLSAEATSVEHELQLVAPDSARAGESLPLRARLYGDLAAVQGARLISAAVRVRLQEPSTAKVLERVDLRPGHAGSMEGALVVPPDAPAQLEIVAQALGAGLSAVNVVKPLRVSRDAVGAPARPRSLRALQSFRAGPVKRVSDAPAPAALQLQVGGGACVPEHPCEAHLHVGAPASSVHVRASPALTPEPASAQPGPEADGVVPLGFTTHGPEAELTVVAERGGSPVARRAFRLPIALGADALVPGPRLLRLGEEPHLALAQEGSGCIVDAHHDGRWLLTASLTDCAAPKALPFSLPLPGVWRMQMHSDPFGAGSAAVRMLYVRHAGQASGEVLAELASALADEQPDDLLAREVVAEPQRFEDRLPEVADYLLAGLERRLVPQPASVSGYPQALARLAGRRATLRNLALVVLLLSGLSLGALVARRGLLASEQAEAILRVAGADAAERGRARLRATLNVLLVVASLSLAFVAIAMYVIARGGGL